jgi:L-arginine dehydrogenase
MQTAPCSVPVCLDAAAVEALLSLVDVPAALRAMFAELAEGQATQPPQSLNLFPGGGDFISYLGVLARAQVFGVKVSPYIAASGGAFVTAWTLLMSMQTGTPLMLCDSKRLTTERTAGTTALAVDLLAADAARVLCVIGSGPIAQAHVRHTSGLRAWREIRVHSPRIGALSADAARAWTALDPRVTLVAERDAATRDADVIMLCTSSAVPVIDVAALPRPALITSISTNAADAHEVAPAALAAMDVYCDYRATTPASAGEMKLATKHHGWSESAVRGDLPGLVAGSAPALRGDRHTFFRSIGLGLEDIAVAHGLYRAHQESAT